MRVLAIIPARGGSKGIPRKNVRLLAGKPLIGYTIQAAGSCDLIDDVYVSTDDEEIAAVAKNFGAEVIERDRKLAEDAVTLDPVIYDAACRIEKEKGTGYDIIITIQPTSPLLTTKTLTAAIRYFTENPVDSLISVVNRPHLSWRREGGKCLPNYAKRLNRQQLPANYLETGAFLITKREAVTQDSRLGERIDVFEVPQEEAIDIDDVNDWVMTETILAKKKVLFRVDGYAALGMGHVYNCITLAYSMIEHEVLLVLHKRSVEGIKKVKETNLNYRVIEHDEELDEVIRDFQPDILVMDRLNTEEQQIRHYKESIPRVVTIEDLGTGTRAADAVINALYTDRDLRGDNIYSGWKYVCLRDEFQAERPGAFSEQVSNVLVMFGGTDPSNYNKMLYDILLRFSGKYTSIRFNFVVGIGYDAEKNGIVTDEAHNIFVYPNVKRVTDYMKTADLAITSQGRTIFELAAMGIPAIVLSQNEREKMHTYASLENGFINLGAQNEFDGELIENTLDWLIGTRAVRKSMHDLMLRYPLREGLERVKDIILG